MRKAFLLRIDPDVLENVQRWANDDLRSLNAQIEFLLRRALQDAGRTSKTGDYPRQACADPTDELPGATHARHSAPATNPVGRFRSLPCSA